MKWLKKRTSQVIILGIGVTVVAAYYHPFALSYPQIGKEWEIVRWDSYLFPIVSGSLVIYTFVCYFVSGEKLALKIIKAGCVFSLVHGILLVLYVATQLFFILNTTPLGRNFLPPRSNYYSIIMGRYTQPYIAAFLTAMVLGLIFYAWQRLTNSEKIGKLEIWVGICTALTLGWARTYLALLTALLVAVGWYFLAKKSHVRLGPCMILSIYPTLFFGGYLTRLLLGANI